MDEVSMTAGQYLQLTDLNKFNVFRATLAYKVTTFEIDTWSLMQIKKIAPSLKHKHTIWYHAQGNSYQIGKEVSVTFVVWHTLTLLKHSVSK